MNNTLSRYLLIPLCLTIVLSACKTRRTAQAVNANMKADSKNFQKVLESSLPAWTYFSAKADIEFKSGDVGSSFAANIRMYKDSLIWFSANMFGIEGARALITKDSVFVMNKIQKTYSVYGKDYLAQYIGGPVEISELQNLLIDNPVYLLSLYKWVSQTEADFTIEAKKNGLSAEHTISNAQAKVGKTTITRLKENQHVVISYEDYKQVSGMNFPHKISVQSTDFSKPFDVKLEYKSPDFTSQQTYPFTVPSSYDRK